MRIKAPFLIDTKPADHNRICAIGLRYVVTQLIGPYRPWSCLWWVWSLQDGRKS
jgi:hypothetical protein